MWAETSQPSCVVAPPGVRLETVVTSAQRREVAVAGRAALGEGSAVVVVAGTGRSAAPTEDAGGVEEVGADLEPLGELIGLGLDVVGKVDDGLHGQVRVVPPAPLTDLLVQHRAAESLAPLHRVETEHGVAGDVNHERGALGGSRRGRPPRRARSRSSGCERSLASSSRRSRLVGADLGDHSRQFLVKVGADVIVSIQHGLGDSSSAPCLQVTDPHAGPDRRETVSQHQRIADQGLTRRRGPTQRRGERRGR
ncbi:MAG: hypothetical protein ACXWW7_14815, partial [Nocardioides sp.]